MTAVPCTAAATVAGTMKIADAIIVPTLIIVASKRPSSRFRSVVLLAGGADELMGLKAKRWNDGTLERWKGSTVQHSIIPSFHHSIIPSFHHSLIPSFHHSILHSAASVYRSSRHPVGERMARVRSK